MKKRIPLYLPTLVFVITTVVFFYDQIFGNYFFWEDFLEYVYPVQTLSARDGGLFGITFWNPYIFGGMPFFADLQSGMLYPLNRLLALFVDSSGTLSVAALQMQIILHFFIAQMSMFFLMRHLKVSDIGGIISSVSYAFSFIMVMHVIHPMMLYHLAWFPLVIMFTMKAIDNNSMRSGIAGGLILGITMLSGHPQTTVYQYLFLGLFIIFRLIEKVKTSKSKITQSIIAVVFLFLFSLGLFFVQYLPSQELADYSQREEITYEKSSEGSLELKQVISSVVPKFFGEINGLNDSDLQWHLTSGGKNIPYYHYWDTGFFFGIMALILGLYAMFYYAKTNLGQFFIAISLLGFLYSLGDNGFLHKIFYNLPFFGSLRMPARMMFFVVISFSILAGFGYDKLFDKDKKIVYLLIAIAIPLLIAILSASGFFSSLYQTPEQIVDSVKQVSVKSLIFTVVSAAAVITAFYHILHRYIIAIVIVLITFFNLYSEGTDFNKSKQNPKDVYTLPANILSTFQVEPPEKLYRVKSRMYKPSYMAFQRNQGMVSKMMLMEGYNPLLLQRIYPANSTSEKSYDLLNIKYIIDINRTNNQPYFRENSDADNHIRLVFDKIVHNQEDMKKYINDSDIDFFKTVVIEKDDQHTIPMDDTTYFDYKVQIISYENDEILMEINSSENAYLVLSEIWYPDWKANVNGVEQKVLRANNSLRAVAIDKGKSTVRMYYKSASFTTGGIFAIITLLAGIAGLVFIKD
jgi:hypothetical protein